MVVVPLLPPVATAKVDQVSAKKRPSNNAVPQYKNNNKIPLNNCVNTKGYFSTHASLMPKMNKQQWPKITPPIPNM